MPLYLYQAAYTAESLAAQIEQPLDRVEAVRPMFESAGARTVASGHPFGEYDVLALYEAPDDTTAASLAQAIAAGGAVEEARTTRLLSGQEWVEPLRRARSVTEQYRPAR
ncbi:MAG: GYD domain-containing protein [Candidatus Dormibacteraeota bacterium]|nr:GYD domain-containing protein [Candidatus Dormibacteraeota bacterium]MBO0759822.1 GYD domain-containing protein [Candidatus Dormibacteraeota bacterium]